MNQAELIKKIEERKAKEWKEISTNGERFVTENNSGYIYKGKRHYDWIRGKTITGPDFKE